MTRFGDWLSYRRYMRSLKRIADGGGLSALKRHNRDLAAGRFGRWAEPI